MNQGSEAMICKINVSEKEIAKKVLDIQIPAYKVEAALINFAGIPQLKDTVDTIIKCRETFLGYMIDGVLIGFISYNNYQGHFQICRLVVDPKHFRKGIAKNLIAYLMVNITKGHTITVSTGAKNIPAKRLYRFYGFHEMEDIEVAPNVYITMLQT